MGENVLREEYSMCWPVEPLCVFSVCSVYIFSLPLALFFRLCAAMLQYMTALQTLDVIKTWSW